MKKKKKMGKASLAWNGPELVLYRLRTPPPDPSGRRTAVSAAAGAAGPAQILARTAVPGQLDGFGGMDGWAVGRGGGGDGRDLTRPG